MKNATIAFVVLMLGFFLSAWIHHDFAWGPFGIDVFIITTLSAMIWALSGKKDRAHKLSFVVIGVGLTLTVFSFVGLCSASWDYRAMGFIAIAGNVLMMVGFAVALATKPRLRTAVKYVLS